MKLARIILPAVLVTAVPQVYYKLQKQSYKKLKEQVKEKEKMYEVVNVKQVSPNEKQFSIIGVDKFETKCSLYEVENAKGIFQLVHGSFEHRGRYLEFINYLNSQGYSVVMADFRGHGLSTNEKYQAGYMDGVEKIVDDLYFVTDYVKSIYPNKKVYLFGHSLGSMLVRAYLQNHDDAVEKVILSGTVMPNPLTKIGIFTAKMVNFYLGEHGYSKILQFLPSDNDWVSYNEENRLKAKNDKLMPKNFQNAGYLTLYEAAGEITNFKAYQVKNPDIPILNIVGIDDKLVAGGHLGVAGSTVALRKLGYDNIKTIIYPNMKHEILNEDGKEQVYADIIRFLEE